MGGIGSTVTGTTQAVEQTQNAPQDQIDAALIARGWSPSEVNAMSADTSRRIYLQGTAPGGSQNAQVIGSSTGGYYERDPTTGEWNMVIGGTGTGDGAVGPQTDAALVRLQQAATLESTLGAEARATEMQPYNIADVNSAIESRAATTRYQDTEAEIAQKNLEREMLSDKWTRAQEAFESSRLAEALANEKKKTATTLLSSIVDNIIPPGQEFLPGLEPGRSVAFPQGGRVQPVAQVNWNQLGSGLDPQTDQALQYLLNLQQQNQGV
jgi:hypothetical protein